MDRHQGIEQLLGQLLPPKERVLFGQVDERLLVSAARESERAALIGYKTHRHVNLEGRPARFFLFAAFPRRNDSMMLNTVDFDSFSSDPMAAMDMPPAGSEKRAQTLCRVGSGTMR